jgi:hypothetical protein
LELHTVYDIHGIFQKIKIKIKSFTILGRVSYGTPFKADPGQGIFHGSNAGRSFGLKHLMTPEDSPTTGTK